jgi:hypothetical protein
MHEYFNANKPQGSTRSQNAIQNRWLLIQKCVNKFCGIKSIIDRRHESGKNEADRVCEPFLNVNDFPTNSLYFCDLLKF